MKKGLWIIAVILVITASYAGYSSSPVVGYAPSRGGAVGPSLQQYPGGPQEYGPNEDTSYFYDRLSAYGNWVELQPYGNVWVPRHMGYRWRPYTDGRWVWTDCGWTWIADEEWGDVPFHYGRWGWDNDLGWFWVPGTVWGPAWVSWRSSDQYMGWAPLPPGVEFGGGIDFNSLSIDIPISFWVFIQGPHFQDQDLNPYVLPFERNQTIVNYTTMHNNIYTRNNRIINEGFGVDEVRRITGRAVPTYSLQNAKQPGLTKVVGQQVQIFRPTIRSNDLAKPKVYLNKGQAVQELAPAKVFEPRGRQTINVETAAVLKRQAEEKNLLAVTQAQEIKGLQMKRDAEALKLPNASEKAKVNKTYEAKITDLKKNHAVETQQLTVRHKNDAVQIKKVTQTPPAKKKKTDQN